MIFRVSRLLTSALIRPVLENTDDQSLSVAVTLSLYFPDVLLIANAKLWDAKLLASFDEIPTPVAFPIFTPALSKSFRFGTIICLVSCP